MANEILSATTSLDQEKFLAARLIQRSHLRLIATSVCDPVKQPEGTGTTANFIRYERMFVPLVAITEAVDPPNSTFAPSTVTAVLDQWVDIITISDKAQLTTSHPLVAEAIKLLSDNAQRVIDREIQLVWLAGTNVIYGDGTVTSRNDISSGMKISDTIIHKSVVTLVDAGAPPRGGPSASIYVEDGAMMDGMEGVEKMTGNSINSGKNYVAFAGPQVIHDIMQASTSLGVFASVAMYANQRALYNAEVGIWLNVRWVETNFIPKFSVLGNDTAAVSSGDAFGTDTPTVTAAAGGSLASHTFAFKVTRKSKLRGFEETISQVHTIASGGSSRKITFDFSNLTAGYVWNLYFDNVSTGSGSSAADTAMGLVAANIEVGTVIDVLDVVSVNAAHPPNHPDTGLVVHPIFYHGDESCNWITLQNLQVFLSADIATPENAAKLRRTISYKFMSKAMIRDQTRLLRGEVVSTY